MKLPHWHYKSGIALYAVLMLWMLWLVVSGLVGHAVDSVIPERPAGELLVPGYSISDGER